MTIKNRLESAFWIIIILEILLSPVTIMGGIDRGICMSIILILAIAWISFWFGFFFFGD